MTPFRKPLQAGAISDGLGGQPSNRLRSSRSSFHGNFAICFVFLCLFATQAHGGNWFVRPNGSSYGSGNGTSWTNAYSGFAGISWSSVACGDTIWIAGGTYNQSLNLQKKCSSASRLFIRRARTDASECTGAGGWQSGFASTVRQIRSSIVVNGDYDYVTVSGRTTASGGSHGWHIDFSGASSGAGIEAINGADADFNTFEYMDIQGPGYITFSGDGRGIDWTPFASPTVSSGNVFSHIKIWNWESAVYNVFANDSTYEYIEMFNLNAVNWQAFHPNGIYIATAQGGVVRYSTLYRSTYGTGEGIFFEQAGGSNNWKIYGNVFYDLNESHLKAIQITTAVTGLEVYNNTFVNTNNTVFVNGGSCGSGSATRNNLAYNSGSIGSCGSVSNNLNTSVNSFANLGARDLHLVSTTGSGYPRNAGTSLPAPYDKDRDGNTRGGDGAWDVGAYEYPGAGGPTNPEPPQGVSALVQ